MQIVIDMKKYEYKGVKKLVSEGLFDYNSTLAHLFKNVANGTPLPEGCDIQRIIPKKVNIQWWTHTECPNPNCNHELSTHHYDGYYFFKHKPNFCPNCGQALLWESEDNKTER